MIGKLLENNITIREAGTVLCTRLSTHHSRHPAGGSRRPPGVTAVGLFHVTTDHVVTWSVVSSAPSSSEILTLLSVPQMRILTVELRKLSGHVRRTVRTPRSGYVLRTFRLRVPDAFEVSLDTTIIGELPWLTIADILNSTDRAMSPKQHRSVVIRARTRSTGPNLAYPE